MPNGTTAKKKTSATGPAGADAIAVLREDHRDVERLFKRFEHAGDGAAQEKQHLATSMATALVQHTTIEQEVVYPWARDYIVDADAMILEAIEEHRVVTWLLADIAATQPDDERFDAKVTVLIEAVRHHVEEEEEQLFPDLRTVATRAELLELGDALLAAKRTAPTVPDPDGAPGHTATAVGHAYDVGKGVVERIGSLAGVN